MSAEPTCATLATKLARILGQVGAVAKTGYNSFHKYDYVTENDLVYAVRQKLADAGIFVFTSVESQAVQIVQDAEKTTALTTVVTRHTFVDGESGEQFSVLSQGQGADPGDKGGYKAITGAMKYFLYKCFMIPTGDDPEGDETTDHRAAAYGTPVQATRQAAPPPTPKAARALSPRATAALAPSVPRDAVPVGLPPGVKWGDVAVHFGKNKGLFLRDLEDNTISWYAEKWEPKPYGNASTISAQDALLKDAVEAWAEEKSQQGGRSA